MGAETATIGVRTLIVAPLTLFGIATAPFGQSPPRLDKEAILHTRFGNDAAWYRGNIPLFASSDATLDAVYYYRWAVFRAHLWIGVQKGPP